MGGEKGSWYYRAMLIVANWKAYVETTEKAKRLYATAKRLAGGKSNEIVLAPPAPYLGYLSLGNRSKVRFGAQDISRAEGGAATGEVTARTVRNVGGTYVIIGHSERRAGGETDMDVREKVKRAFAAGLTPIVCIGEGERDTEAHYLTHLRTQLKVVFEALNARERLQIVVAYEPIWAIGKSAAEAITPRDLNEMILYLRKVLGEYVTPKQAGSVRILYGGSVEPGNIRALSDATGIDGFLIGRATTEPVTFTALVKAIS